MTDTTTPRARLANKAFWDHDIAALLDENARLRAALTCILPLATHLEKCRLEMIHQAWTTSYSGPDWQQFCICGLNEAHATLKKPKP